MKKIKILIISSLLLFSTTFLYLMINNNCKSLSFIKSTMDLGTGNIQACFSLNNMRKNVKGQLKDFPYLKDFAIEFYVKYFRSQKISEQEEKKIKLQIEDSDQNLSKLHFVKGITSGETIIKYKSISSDDNYEFNNWYRSHGGNWNTKFDSGNDINKKNIHKLKLAWKYSTIDPKNIKKKWKSNIELNPVFINNKIIFVSADWKVVALDAKSGQLLWELQSDFMPSRRGIIAENDKKFNLENLFIPIGDLVYKINAKNGKVVKKFGNNGFVKINTLVAPMIYKENIIIVGKEKLSVFNKNTGKFIYEINVHPEGKNFYGGIIWGGVALDKNKGFVYVNTGNPKPHFHGVTRPGNNKRSDSVVAIDLNKKKIIWDFQEISHDIWDLDIPSPPIIHNLKIDNKLYEVVISVTKAGNTLILERNTGKPIFDITYKKAPKSKNYGEIAAPFQIFLKKPERFSKVEYGLEDINKLPEEKRDEIKKILKKSNYGWFETPSFEKNLINFGLHGGALWPGAAIDPINQNLFIPVNNIPWISKNIINSKESYTSFPEDISEYYKIYIDKCSGCHGKKRNGLRVKRGEKMIKRVPALVGFYATPNKIGNFDSLEEINNKHNTTNLTSLEFEGLKKLFKWWDKNLYENDKLSVFPQWYQFITKDGLPASNPPWGYIAKLDLVSGKILFKSPVGYMSINGKREKIGTANYGGVAINAGGVLFFTGTEDSLAYALDANSGEELWSYQMEAGGSAPPIIFNLNGKQYVSFISTGGYFHNFKKKGSTIYTFAISE